MMLEEKKSLQNFPPQLIAFIYQYLPIKEILKLIPLCKKFKKAFQQDFLWSSFAKNNYLFIPEESDKFQTWREYFLYLKKLQINMKSGKPNLGYKMTPYRGHKAPISAIEIFENKKLLKNTYVSGDMNGELLTWKIDEEGDKEKDPIIKADSEIVGIKNINDGSNMLVWTSKNKFYLYEVDMFKNTENDSERFTLIKNFELNVDDNPMHQIYYEKETNTIYMSSFLFDGNYKKKSMYSCDLKNFQFTYYKISYGSRESHLVSESENLNYIPNNMPNAPYINYYRQMDIDDDEEMNNFILPHRLPGRRPHHRYPRRPIPVFQMNYYNQDIYSIKDSKKKILIFSLYATIK